MIASAEAKSASFANVHEGSRGDRRRRWRARRSKEHPRLNGLGQT
ncbi:unnamed protein product [Musa textilis]